MIIKLNCPRCGELNIVYDVNSKKKFRLSLKEKKFIFNKSPYLCIPCIMQLKSRYKISIDHNPYEKKVNVKDSKPEEEVKPTA